LRLDPDAEIETTLHEFVRRDKERCPFLEFSVKRDQMCSNVTCPLLQPRAGRFDLCAEFARLDQRPT
jgi:hypothetical protein